MTGLLPVSVFAIFLVVSQATGSVTKRNVDAELILRSSCQKIKSSNPQAVSGEYEIFPLLSEGPPICVYCEMTISDGGFTFLPHSLTLRKDAQKIVDALFKDRKNVLLKLQKKVDKSEYYTLIQPHRSYAEQKLEVLVNSFAGYTSPVNQFMRYYIFLGILPQSVARSRKVQGFRANGIDVQFQNCDANPNSLFALFPNFKSQTPSSYHSQNLVYENAGVAVDWRSKAKPIHNRVMAKKFFFLTELHFGGCGCYTSSDRWAKYGYHATAIGIR